MSDSEERVNVYDKNIITSALEPLAVDLGVHDYINNVANDGFLNATENAIDGAIDSAQQAWGGLKQQASNVAGYIAEDWHNLTMSAEERAEQQRQQEAEEAQRKAEEEEQQRLAEEYRAFLDKSYILHTAMVTCSYAYTTTEMHPSYIVLPTSHGVTVHGNPQLTTEDYIADEHVLNFGICRSPLNPDVQAAARKILDEVQEESASWIDKLMGLFVDKSNKDVCTTETGEDGELQSLAASCAGKCCPIFDAGWSDGKDDVLIEGKTALLGRCTMNCLYGGEITIQSSGQPE